MNGCAASWVDLEIVDGSAGWFVSCICSVMNEWFIIISVNFYLVIKMIEKTGWMKEWLDDVTVVEFWLNI